MKSVNSPSPGIVKNEMSELISFLIEEGLVNDQNFPFLRRMHKNECEVSFNGTEWVSIAMGDIGYENIHRELCEKRAYNVKFLDEGILQMMYRFSGNRLVRHRLAYFPSPNLRPFSETPESYLEDELYLDIMSRRIIPFPLRFDFDEEAFHDMEHPKCHLTLGDVKCCRIPVSAPLTPRRFIGFILRNFYQTDEHVFTDNLPNQKIIFPKSITENESQIIYVSIPEGTAI
jgi:hypothetical protein